MGRHQSNETQDLINRSGSMFGVMHVSHRKTAPRFGFGSGNRETQARVRVSEEHSKAANTCLHSPGPVYPSQTSLGKIPESRKPTASSWSFPKDVRFQTYEDSSAMNLNPTTNGKFSVPGSNTYKYVGAFGEMPISTKKTMPNYGFGSSTRDHVKKVVDGEATGDFTCDYPRVSPGPMVCYNKSSMGNQASSVKRSNPSWVQGSARRFRYDYVERAAQQPAAGEYDLGSGMGEQPASNKKSNPQFSFGTGERESLRKLYVSKEHSKDSYGLNSPGPGALNLKGSMGKQSDSRKKSNPGWGFGSAKRFQAPGRLAPVGVEKKPVGRGPGPGTYSPQ